MEPKLEFAFDIEVVLSRKIGTGGLTQGGERAFVEILDGSFKGPRLKGKVLRGGGGDWAHVRPDGVLDFDARYWLQEDDGTLIYIQNRGFRWGSQEVMAKLARREPVLQSEYYMRVTPRFEVRPGPHDWLAKHVFIGIGDKTPTGNIISYYQVL
jgi:hypothetical protein